ncbi:MAG: T9SS type A sorting domain-containing protein [Saprospiraceae bacterium]|nr:T9SS type A sorting domain-containing protein [Saprospiraceae bacterium]
MLLTSLPLFAQWKIAQSSADGLITTRIVEVPSVSKTSTGRAGIEIHLREGYPKVFAANTVFKNFRNVTLEDLDGDGADEIIFGVADKFFVYRRDTVWWSRELSGLARFPAAVGDLESDGIKDIVVLTGFNDDDGRVYAFNSRGIDKPGWPKSFAGHWMISSPALMDVDQDGRQEIVCSDLESGLGSVYLLRSDGSMYSDQWPVTLPNVPAVTPSIGDIDHDGSLDIVVNSTREIYAFDLQGNIKPGWPFGNGLTKFSFQSPILADLEGDGSLDIITEGHGDLSLYITLDAQGNHREGWPKPVPQGQWTFHTPTVIEYRGEPLILTGRPISDGTAKPMLFAWRPDGSLLDGFPIVKSGGLEGMITVADIDKDDEPEIIFPSNMIDSTGHGFIHAYELDGSGEVPGFPIRPYGWTYLNGATLGDVDGNGLLDMVILTYTQSEGSIHDSALLYVYEIDAPADSEHILWSTYKGSNKRDGLFENQIMTSSPTLTASTINVFPNPASNYIFIDSKDSNVSRIDIFNSMGIKINNVKITHHQEKINLDKLSDGIYVFKIYTRENYLFIKKVFIIR